MSMKPSHRFAIAVDIDGMFCDVLLNDVPVIRNYTTDRINLTAPVSPFVLSGTNILVIRAALGTSETGKSSTKATAILRATPYDSDEWEEIFRVESRPQPQTKQGEETAAKPLASSLGPVSPQTNDYDGASQIMKTGRSIALTAQTGPWRWADSQPIRTDEATRHSLRSWYRRVWEDVASGRPDLVAGQFSEKIEELVLAFRLSRDEIEHEIGLTRKMLREDLRLLPVDWEGTQIETAGQGRLARLYHPREGTLICFEGGSGLFHSFEFWLRREGEGWRVTR